MKFCYLHASMRMKMGNVIKRRSIRMVSLKMERKSWEQLMIPIHVR